MDFEIGELFCAEQTKLLGEPIFGTATPVTTWFLLEYRLPWREKATTDNDLPDEVQDFLNQQLTGIPGSRLLFIKNENQDTDHFRLFVVRSDEKSPQLYDLTIGRYEDLLAIDFMGLSEGLEAFKPYLREEPIYVVCSNGRRDKCCARYGLPMAQALHQIAGDDVWQASHMGGHRYAPNVIVFPSCANYGLMEPTHSLAIVEATAAGEIFDLEFYRGRNYYDPAVQAADYFLRSARDLFGFCDLKLIAVEEQNDQSSLVTFQTGSGQRVQLGIQQQAVDDAQFVSCSTPKSKPGLRFSLSGIWDDGQRP